MMGEINFSKYSQTKGLMKKNDSMIFWITCFSVLSSEHVWGINGRKGLVGAGRLKKNTLIIIKSIKIYLYQDPHCPTASSPHWDYQQGGRGLEHENPHASVKTEDTTCHN